MTGTLRVTASLGLVLMFGVPSVPAGETCPVNLSTFAEDSIQALEDRYCEEAQDGWFHENLPTSDPVQQERDTIFMLLAFALVRVEWDTSRGHQIGAVIVDQATDAVLWVDLNTNFVNNSPIDHAEARAIRNYVQTVNDGGTSDPYWALLDGTTVYASLEPCQMCAGTINMGRVDRVVFGMEDDGFGDALDYLHTFPFHADFEFHSNTRTAQALIAEVAANPNTGVTTVIRNAGYALDFAIEDLEGFTPAYAANQQALNNALATLAAAQAGPPEIPDGSFGDAVEATRGDPSGSTIHLTWDAATCAAVDHHLVFGTLDTVGELAVGGGVCGLGTSGAYAWDLAPASSLWFLVLGSSGGVEGSWGTDGAGVQRRSTAASGQCGFDLLDNSGQCP